MGNDVADIANSIAVQRKHAAAGPDDVDGAMPRAVPLEDVPPAAWASLCGRALEPNGYFLPDWARAVSATARGRTGASALTAWSGSGASARLIGLIPVISLWRAYHLPLPALATADPYGTLGTPIVDRDVATESVAALLQNARRSGAHALVMRDVTVEGLTMTVLREVLAREGLTPIVLRSQSRACLDATAKADDVLRDALGPKKLKELRRQRNRLAEHGEIAFDIARTPQDVASALPIFLALEASGWKASRGTALKQHDGDLAFIRTAATALAAKGQCEIVTLRTGDAAVASAIVLRHLDRAFYFKLGIDENFARHSVGVQLTLELTRHLCADPDIAMVDSTAAPGHPMIDPIWRGRLAVGDVLIPLRRHDPVVSAIRFALIARQGIRVRLSRALQSIRKRREKKT